MDFANIIKFKLRMKFNLNFMFHKLMRVLSPFSRDKLLTIIPHEGLGDLISILPALKILHNEGVHITLAADTAKWCQIKNAFLDVPDVDIIQMAPNSDYSIPSDILNNNKSVLVPLGYFSNSHFIIDYPYSFFWQLGVDRQVMTNPLHIKPCLDDFQLPKYYDFIDLGTSKGAISTDIVSLSDNKVTFLNNTDMVVSISGSERHSTLNPSVCFHQKIFIALRSQVIICSDAALFNAVIRMSTRPKIIVHTRKHYHSHCKEIYGDCKFDGGIYEFPARNA